MYNERLRYLTLIKRSHAGKRRAIKTIMRETKFRGTIEDMAQIVFTPSEEEQRFHINKMRLKKKNLHQKPLKEIHFWLR